MGQRELEQADVLGLVAELVADEGGDVDSFGVARIAVADAAGREAR